MADANKKRRLCDMDAEEFMMHGFDSDVCEDDNEPKMAAKNVSQTEVKDCSQQHTKKSKSADHKNQLARLEEKDPEFFKFLKENDKELLDFNDSDTGSEVESDDDDDDDDDVEDDGKSKDSKNDKKHKKSTEKTDESDEEDDDDDLGEEDTENEKDVGKTVTLEMIKQWRTGLEKNSLHSLKQTLRAFRSAVHGALDIGGDDKSQPRLTFKVEGDTVFNAIIQLCLKQVYPVLFHHVGGTHNKHGKRVLPSSHTKWSQVKTPVKHYLNDVLQLLRTLAEPSMLCVILRHAQQLSPYYACFPKVARAFIKRSVRMWSRGEEHVRVLAFLGIRNVATMMPSSLLEFSVKQLYMNFVKNTKFTSPKTKPVITFMQNSLVEIFSLDDHLTYQHGFVYIRQLAIHLRNAIMQKKKASYQSVYNWQYIHCLHLWCRIVSEVKSNGLLDPLIYPLVQTVIGAIKLVPAARYYPLRFHCIRSLNLLSQSTDTYIPVAPFLLEILESAEFNKKTKMSTAKPTEFSCILKVSKQQLGTKPYQDAVVDHIFELLLEFFSVHAHSIAFPEIALPAVVRLRKFIKTTSVPKYRKQLKQLVDKIEETSTEVTNRRSKVSFSPKDIDEVERWTAQYRQQPNAIVKFYKTWKAMKPSVTQNEELAEGENDMNEETSDDEQIETPKRKRGSSDNKKEQEKQTTKKMKKNLKKPAGEKNTQTTNESMDADKEDIVEDFQFSSEED
ncbi:nucleolar complex protein 2 homolog isoform X3 [Orbicella faveolata]|uniref:nucleolar complex protein 2 homolog isoform X2 n=1 Tax=Orbicella faveolata TaxID=48498 RepID=UPI0009E48C1D|nr:nucleolar complex protein 2 homolog isoform X2 [Orbicella faveolata]XP_020615680.1 nucleolar complex protein 2 homolog isoform X3 [Orbicella faveolata]